MPNCAVCKEEMQAERSTKKFCGPTCRQKKHRERTTIRAKTIKENFHANGDIVCEECGHPCDPRSVWVRAPEGKKRAANTVRVLCGSCHSTQSREAFRRNHPDAGPGWGKMRADQLRAMGIPARKRNRPRDQEVLVDPDQLDKMTAPRSGRKGPRYPEY